MITKMPARILAGAIDKIAKHPPAAAQIICLHELFLGEYFCAPKAPASSISPNRSRPTSEKPLKIAKEKKRRLVVSLLNAAQPVSTNNSVAVLDADGSFLGKYPQDAYSDDPLYYGKFYFTPGRSRLPIDTKYGRIGVQICWDQWYPEGRASRA